MNAAMQTVPGIVSGKIAESKGDDNRRGEQPADPFALLLDQPQEPSQSHGLSPDESELRANSADTLPDSFGDGEGGKTSLDAAFMQALAALLGDDEIASQDAGSETGDGAQAQGPVEGEADEPVLPASNPALPAANEAKDETASYEEAELPAHESEPELPAEVEIVAEAGAQAAPGTETLLPPVAPQQRQASNGDQANRRATIDPAPMHDGAALHRQAISGETIRDAAGRLQQPAVTAEFVSVRPEQAHSLTPRTMPANAEQFAAMRTAAGAQPFERVQIISQQSSAAPMPVLQLPLSLTGQSVVQGIEAASPLRPVQADMANMISQRIAQSGATSLKIQLQPTELGTVTARLTATGAQLSVEIQVETSDARQRLSAESDAIMKAMRSIGYDVERITIQQSSPAPNQPTTGQQPPGGREFAGGQQQAQSDENGRGGRNGHAQGNSQGKNGNEPAQNHTDGSVYI